MTNDQRLNLLQYTASMPVDVAAEVMANRTLSSTSANVHRFLHINRAPAAAAIAISQTSTPTLTQAGENTSRASSCRRTSRM